MESVMNFLADNYIWFFVAAGVLCFALIGFIIDSKKKQKNSFKGDSIDESVNLNNAETNNEPVQIIGNTVDMGGEATLGNNQPLEDTMEINDIPLASEPVQETKAEFFSGPIEMPSVEPAPTEVETVTQMDIPRVEETPVMEPTGLEEPVVQTEPQNLENTISYEEVKPLETPVMEMPSIEPEKQENTNIFEEL